MRRESRGFRQAIESEVELVFSPDIIGVAETDDFACCNLQTYVSRLRSPLFEAFRIAFFLESVSCRLLAISHELSEEQSSMIMSSRSP